jgi:hypothetical protein
MEIVTLKIETKTTGKKWTRGFDSWEEAVEWAARVLPAWSAKYGDDIMARGPAGRELIADTRGVTVL